MKPFTIYPAIDLLNGKVVRLQQGNPDQKTIYSSEPAVVAKRWIENGAEWIHLVNLDAAFEFDASKNWLAIEKIISLNKEKSIKIQLGGGIRSLNTIKHFLESGITRVILGTIAVENFDMVKEAIKTFGTERIVIGIDALDGFVRTHGWKMQQSLSALSLACNLKDEGINTIIYTDIKRDGMGTGVNLESTIDLAQKTGMEIIASGGIHSLDNVIAVRQAGISGVIVGKALYENNIEPKSLFSLQEKKC
ncbi:MAG TPA: 1-(5-phosphoribosyl)-5-[(5-phosphoribosylamino)methylideneamino]imidazole-4-carboxamide isomerase [Anaerolineaceae bacterium]|nr:1-(5-phosphoribosyl)-5-[(5-phosphoribosylamino)methylideneamino]imidazole-4-carboxamide isomerase [Anaerolineaceae bacterium]